MTMTDVTGMTAKTVNILGATGSIGEKDCKNSPTSIMMLCG